MILVSKKGQNFKYHGRNELEVVSKRVISKSLNASNYPPTPVSDGFSIGKNTQNEETGYFIT